MSRHEEGRRTKQQRDEHSELFSPPNDEDARPLACLRDNFKRATIRQSNKGISHVGFIHGRKLARYWGERLSRHPRKYAPGTENPRSGSAWFLLREARAVPPASPS